MGHDIVHRPPGAQGGLLPRGAVEAGEVVDQSRTLDIDLTLTQNLKYHAALHGFSNREATERARFALELVGLADRGGERVRALSGGQLRRVEIARSMMHRPDLLLLDEPTVGLDLGSREGVIKIVRDLVAKERLGVLWATHLMDEVLRTDQVVVLERLLQKVQGPGAHRLHRHSSPIAPLPV